jgi:hypothetical protein
MLFCLLLAAVTFEAKPADDGVAITVKNDDAQAIVIIGEEVTAQRKGKDLVLERVLEVEDLGPIARSPQPPRWLPAKGERTFAGFLVLAHSTVVITQKDAVHVRTAPATDVFSIAEQSVSRIEHERNAFGKFFPALKVTARYSARKLVKDLITRPDWDFGEFAVVDAPSLDAPWPVLLLKAKVTTHAL